MLNELRTIARRGKGAPKKRAAACVVHVLLWPLLLLPRLIWPLRRQHRGANPTRILLIRIDGIGDLAMTSGIFPALRKRFPQSEIDFVCSDAARTVAELLVNANWVDELFPMPLTKRKPADYLGLGKTLRTKNYDVALDLRGDIRNVGLMWWARIPRRLGLSGSGLEYLLTDVVKVSELSHQADECLGLVACIGVDDPLARIPQLPVRPEDKLAAAAWLNAHGYKTGRRLCAFHLGAFIETKVWPLEHFATVANYFIEVHDAEILIVGGKAETRTAQQFLKLISRPAIVATGETSLPVTAALLARCAVFVGNDSGPAHLAASVGCPVVVLFGPASPERYRPLSPKTVVMSPSIPCDPACDKTCARPHSRCMLEHSPQRVIAAAESLMQEGRKVASSP